MGMRIAAKIILCTICAVSIFFGIGFIAYAIALALTQALGMAGAAAITGAIFIVPPFLWALLAVALHPARRPPAPNSGAELFSAVIAGLAKEVPWAAMLGAGLAGVAETILKRKKKN